MARSSKIVRWLPAAKSGSPRALGEVLEACRRYLLWVARDQLDPGLQAKGGASDLVQETFLEAHRDFACFQGDNETELLAWLRRMLLNNLANFARGFRETAKRRIGKERSLDTDQPGGAVPEPQSQGRTASFIMMKREQNDVIKEAMSRLPADYQQVITLWQEETRTFEQIGKLMHRSANGTRMLWVRAIERLQEVLETLEGVANPIADPPM